jgi:hypothetical protein
VNRRDGWDVSINFVAEAIPEGNHPLHVTGDALLSSALQTI